MTGRRANLTPLLKLAWAPRFPSPNTRLKMALVHSPSFLYVTFLSSSTNSYQITTVLTGVGARLKPAKGRNMLAPSQNGKPTLPKLLAGLSRNQTNRPAPSPPLQSSRQQPGPTAAALSSLATDLCPPPFLIGGEQLLQFHASH